MSLTFKYGRFSSTPGKIYGVSTCKSFCQPQAKKDQKGSLHTTQTNWSQTQGKSHLSHEENTKALQLEINHLKRKLCHEWRKQTPSSSNSSSDGEKDDSYRRKSRTLPVSLSRTTKTTTLSAETRVHSPRARETMR